MGERRFEGRVALITGASSGIGRAACLRLAREGADVVVCYAGGRERAEKVAAEARELGVRAVIVQADVSQESDVLRLFEESERALGPIDVLVNNAGIQSESASHETSVEDFERVIGVDLRGAFLCARSALRSFLEHDRRGTIVSTSSVHALIPKPRYLAYAMAKGGLTNMTRTLALEYAGRGIRVNAVGPGAIATAINESWKDDREARDEVEAHIPMGRAGEPEEMAAVIAFLASDDASYVTGQTLYACGGLTLYPEFREPWSS
ncbi:MAG: SDR family oxidoreductase [Myxococcota bacterium]|nr:SDR family oxidoreductase [Myxococcota bacterium]